MQPALFSCLTVLFALQAFEVCESLNAVGAVLDLHKLLDNRKALPEAESKMAVLEALGEISRTTGAVFFLSSFFSFCFLRSFAFLCGSNGQMITLLGCLVPCVVYDLLSPRLRNAGCGMRWDFRLGGVGLLQFASNLL